MTNRGFKILDSDIHIIEPPDLWQQYIDPQFRDRAPIGLTEKVGDVFMVSPSGEPWGRVGTAEPNRHRLSGSNFKDNEAKYKRYEDMGWSNVAQLSAMDEEGVDAAVLYPSRGLFALSIPEMDPLLAAAIARAYNRWIYEFCQLDTDRLFPAAMISPYDITGAASELLSCSRDMGFKGVFLRPNIVNGLNWHDPTFEPFWRSLEDLQMPIGFHEGAGSALSQVGQQFQDNHMLRHVFCHPVEQMLAVASFCGGGILERHPKLRVAFLEGNCSWLPFLMWRLDEHWSWRGDVHAPDLRMPPSEYFKLHCFASVEADEEPVKYTIDYMGNQQLLFSTDFPHGDSKFPASVDRFLNLPITDEDKARILWDNCARYYGLE